MQIMSIPMYCAETNNSIDDYMVIYGSDLFLAKPPAIARLKNI